MFSILIHFQLGVMCILTGLWKRISRFDLRKVQGSIKYWKPFYKTKAIIFCFCCISMTVGKQRSKVIVLQYEWASCLYSVFIEVSIFFAQFLPLFDVVGLECHACFCFCDRFPQDSDVPVGIELEESLC